MIRLPLTTALLFIILYSMGHTAHASDESLTLAFKSCIKSAGGIDPAILECQGQEYERQDKRLNLAYRKLVTKLPAAKIKELRNVQRSWLVYAEAKCNFYYDDQEYSGTLNRIESSYCGVTERARRAEELERFITW